MKISGGTVFNNNRLVLYSAVVEMRGERLGVIIVVVVT